MTTQELQLIQVRQNQLLDRILPKLLLVVCLMVGGSLIRVLEIGFQPVMIMHFGLAALLMGVTYFRQHLSFPVKVWTIIGIFMLAGLGALFMGGVLNKGSYFVAFSVIFAAATLGNGPAVAILVFHAFSLVLVFVLHQQGMPFLLDLRSLDPSWVWWVFDWMILSAMLLFYLAFYNQTRIILRESLEELKQKQQGLEQANTTNKRLLSIVSHDLRGPVGALYNLLEEVKSPDQIDEDFLKLGKKSLQSTYNLLEDLLTWAKAQQDLLRVEPLRQEVSELIHSVAQQKQFQALRKDLQLDFEVTSPLWVNTDSGILRMVLHNLIQNAIKFSQRKQRIKLRAARFGEQVEIVVSDQGVGMEPEQLTQLFQSRLLPSTPGTEGERGTGLGLSLCLDFVEKMGGRLLVESTAGQGSQFTLLLPWAQESSAP